MFVPMQLIVIIFILWGVDCGRPGSYIGEAGAYWYTTFIYPVDPKPTTCEKGRGTFEVLEDCGVYVTCTTKGYSVMECLSTYRFEPYHSEKSNISDFVSHCQFDEENYCTLRGLIQYGLPMTGDNPVVDPAYCSNKPSYRNYYIPDPSGTCDMYHQCTTSDGENWEVDHTEICQPGYRYKDMLNEGFEEDKDRPRVCVHEGTYGDCGLTSDGRLIETTDTVCDIAQADQFFPVVGNWYYVCRRFLLVMQEFECPYGFEFNPDKEGQYIYHFPCVQGDCGVTEPPTPPPPPPPPTATTGCLVSETFEACRPKLKWVDPHPLNCLRYYFCENRTESVYPIEPGKEGWGYKDLYECEPGYVFDIESIDNEPSIDARTFCIADPDNALCPVDTFDCAAAMQHVSPHHVLFQNPFNCQEFYHCRYEGGVLTPFLESCPQDMLFFQDWQRCEYAEDNICPQGVCGIP